jgi:hypothetical protein
MRHDSHLVEELTAPRTEAVGRMIDIGRIEPNPNQPRKSFGDLTEMVASVKEKGILSAATTAITRSSPASDATRRRAWQA